MLTLAVLIATATLAAVMTAHMIAASRRNRYAASASALALFFGLITLSTGLLVIHMGEPGIALVRARAVLALIALPAIYLHFQSASSPTYAWGRRHLWYLAPAAAGAAALAVGAGRLIDPLLLVTYAGSVVGLIAIERRADKHLAGLGDRRGPTVLWLRIVIVVLVVLGLLEGLIFVHMLQGGLLQTAAPLTLSFLTLVALIAFSLIGALGRPSLFEHVHNAALASTSHRPPDRSATAPDPADIALCEAAMALLGDPAVLGDEALTLTRLARKLGVPARPLSNAINRVHGKSFSDVVNDCRVELSAALMRQDADRGLLEIMYAVGYGSKSNFYKQFTRRMGEAPAAYRRNQAAGRTATARKADGSA